MIEVIIAKRKQQYFIIPTGCVVQEGGWSVNKYEIVWQGVAPFGPYSMGCTDHPAHRFVFELSECGS